MSGGICVFCFSLPQAGFALVFLYSFGIGSTGYYFSIKKGDSWSNFVSCDDSIMMNLRKSLSVSESESDKYLGFLKEAMIAVYFFIGPMLHHSPWSPICVGNKPVGKPIRPCWDRDTLPVYSYQERCSESQLISGFSAWKFNSGQNSTLNTNDPQPPPSSTCKIGLIGSGPIWPPVRPSKGQSSILQAIDHSVAGSMTAQAPESRRPRPTGGLIGGCYLSEEMQSAYSKAPDVCLRFFVVMFFWVL